MNAQVQDNQILFAPGRIVQGDLYEPQTEDMQGNQLTIKTGPNIGKSRVNYFFSVAIPKNPGEQAWWQTQWGQRVYAIAMAAWPTFFDANTRQCIHPRFAWKVSDGDDTTPNPDAQMRRNCDREGFPGHWIVRFGSGFSTKIVDETGAPMLQPGLVKRGFWVEVLGTCAGNENAQKPGLYINHQIVAYRAPGKEIVSGPDPRAVGFGRAALPAGVTAAPIGNTTNMPAPAPAVPGAPPAVPGALPPAGAVPGVPVAQPAMSAPAAFAPQPPAATPVQAHPGFLQPPVGGAPAVPGAPMVPGAPTIPSVPGVPAAPAAFVCPLGAPVGYKMTNLNGPRYEAMRGGGWTDALLLQHGHMVKL